jgi:hypothetical protein
MRKENVSLWSRTVTTLILWHAKICENLLSGKYFHKMCDFHIGDNLAFFGLNFRESFQNMFAHVFAIFVYFRENAKADFGLHFCEMPDL